MLARGEERWATEKTPNHQDVEDGPHSIPLKGGPTGFQNGSTILPQRECCPLQDVTGCAGGGGFFSVHPYREAESEAPGREPGKGRLLLGMPHTPAPPPPCITICWAVFLFIKPTLSFKLRLLLPWGSQQEHSLYRKAQISPGEYKVRGQHFPVFPRMEGA